MAMAKASNLMIQGTAGLSNQLPTEKSAISTITSIALTQSRETTDKTLLYDNGKRFFLALFTLSKNNAFVAVTQLQNILKLRGRDRCEIKLNLENFTFTVNVMDLDTFQLNTIMALNYIPANIRNIEGSTELILGIFHHLFDFMKVKNQYSVLVTRTAYLLMTKYLAGADMRASQNLILSVANSFMTLSPYAKAIDYIEKMSNIIITDWPVERVKAEGIGLCHMASWDNCDAFVLSCLINNWPAETSILPYLDLVADRTSVMLSEKSFSSGAMKILRASIKHVDVNVWYTVFVPSLLKFMPSDAAEARAYMKSTLTECASLAVKQFGAESAYLGALEANVNASYTILVLYCGAHIGSIDIHQNEFGLDDQLRNIIVSGCDNVAYYALKTLCVFNNKRANLPKWQVECVYQYLVDHKLDLDTDCFKDFHYFFSHLCIKANEYAPPAEDVLGEFKYYSYILECFYKESMAMIKSKDPQQIRNGTEIFNLARSVFERDSHNLKLKYKLPREDLYAKNQAPVFKGLVSQGNWYFSKIETWYAIQKEFLDSEKYYPEICKILLKWFEESLPGRDHVASQIFFQGLDWLRSGSDNESIEKGCSCITIALSDGEVSGRLHSILLIVIEKELLNVQLDINGYEDLLQTLTFTPVFGLTRSIPQLLQFRSDVIPRQFLMDVFIYCCYFIRKMMVVITYDTEQEFFTSPSKLVENMLIACLDALMMAVKLLWNEDAFFREAVNIANLIIETSNMKRPVVVAATAVRGLCMDVLASQCSLQEGIILKFLEYILFSIYAAPISLTSKIRRNPEHRLIIHAIVVADQRPNHPFLARAMKFLLGVLSDHSAASGSIASALHTVEIILSENSLRISTLPFVSSVMVHCINAFSSKDWQIKNATIQVLKSLIDRLLGQKTNLLCRHHTIEDVFLLFPDLGIYFFSKLQDPHPESVRESIIAILAVFSESHRKCSKFLSKDLQMITESFLAIFLDFVCTDASTIGIFAAKAYAALYPHLHIPFIICDIVNCVILKFCTMKKNIFYTFLCLLQALYERFNMFCYVPYHKLGLSIIESSFKSLTVFLEKFNKLYEFSLYSLLSVKSNSIVNIEETLTYHLEKRTYQSRLWLNNNIPYLLNHVAVKKLPDILKTCLSGKSSLSLKIHYLRAVANRHHELMEQSLVGVTLLVIIESFFEFPFTNVYLLINYVNVILLLFDTCDFTISENLLNRLRCEYKQDLRDNIYFASVIICLLSRVSSYTETDQIFLKNSITLYQNATFVEDRALNFHVSSTLKYLYKCVKISDRFELLKLAFVLLLNDDTSVQIRYFVTEAFSVQLSSAFETVEVLISYDHLLTQLGDEIKVCCFLVDLTIFVSSLKDGFEDNGKFYFKQNSDICLHKYSVKDMLLKNVEHVFKRIPRSSCLTIFNNCLYVIND